MKTGHRQSFMRQEPTSFRGCQCAAWHLQARKGTDPEIDTIREIQAHTLDTCRSSGNSSRSPKRFVGFLHFQSPPARNPPDEHYAQHCLLHNSRLQPERMRMATDLAGPRGCARSRTSCQSRNSRGTRPLARPDAPGPAAPQSCDRRRLRRFRAELLKQQQCSVWFKLPERLTGLMACGQAAMELEKCSNPRVRRKHAAGVRQRQCSLQVPAGEAPAPADRADTHDPRGVHEPFRLQPRYKKPLTAGASRGRRRCHCCRRAAPAQGPHLGGPATQSQLRGRRGSRACLVAARWGRCCQRVQSAPQTPVRIRRLAVSQVPPGCQDMMPLLFVVVTRIHRKANTRRQLAAVLQMQGRQPTMLLADAGAAAITFAAVPAPSRQLVKKDIL